MGYLSTIPELCEDKDKFIELNTVNNGVPDDKIITFYEWLIKTYVIPGNTSSLPEVLKEIIKEIEKYRDKDGRIDPRLINTFYTLLYNNLDLEPRVAKMEKELEKLFLVVKRFQ